MLFRSGAIKSVRRVSTGAVFAGAAGVLKLKSSLVSMVTKEGAIVGEVARWRGGEVAG